MNAHNKSIHVAVLKPEGEVQEFSLINEPKAVRRLAKKLHRQAAGSEVRCCYEAGPCGFILKRHLEASCPSRQSNPRVYAALA